MCSSLSIWAPAVCSLAVGETRAGPARARGWDFWLCCSRDTVFPEFLERITVMAPESYGGNKMRKCTRKLSINCEVLVYGKVSICAHTRSRSCISTLSLKEELQLNAVLWHQLACVHRTSCGTGSKLCAWAALREGQLTWRVGQKSRNATLPVRCWGMELVNISTN